MRALPAVARRVSSNPDAYVYLAESIRAWPDQAALAADHRRGRLDRGRLAQPHRRHRRPPPRHPPLTRLIRRSAVPNRSCSSDCTLVSEQLAINVRRPSDETAALHG